MHEQSHHVVAVVRQSEQRPDTHIVDATQHGAVHRLGVVCPVALGPRRVQSLIGSAVVGLLEEDIGANARILQSSVVLHRSGRNVHVYAAYRPILMAYRVDGLDGFQYIFYRTHLRVLARLQGQPLVSHVLQGNHFAAYLLLCQSASGDMPVLCMVGAIYAPIRAVVREIQRGKHHDAVAIDALLQSSGNAIHTLLYLLVAHFDEQGRFAVCDSLALFSLG